MEVGTMPTEMMDVDSIDVDRRDLETPALQPTGSVVRSELNECHVLDLLIIRRDANRLSCGPLWPPPFWPLWFRCCYLTATLPRQHTAPSAKPVAGRVDDRATGRIGAMAQKDLGLKNPNDLYVGCCAAAPLKTR